MYASRSTDTRLRDLCATALCRCGKQCLIVAITLAAGCGRPIEHAAPGSMSQEASLARQAAAVRDGRSALIRLDHTLVRDDDLAPLADLGSTLRRVNLSRTEISDDGLARICDLADLEQLRLSSPRVTDGGLAHVARLKRLRFLHLLDMPISDAGLDRLRGLNQLESLYLDGTRVTDDGLARLVKALPNVHLHFNDHHHRLDSHRDDHVH